MAQGVNKWIGVGNLGNDPTVKYVQSGTAVCTLRLAVTERVKRNDAWVDDVQWLDVVTFGKTAENAGQYLTKGRQVYVEGRLQTRSYKDKEGVEKWKTEVVASQVLFLGGGERTTGREQVRHAESDPPAPSGGGFIDDELPFMVKEDVW